MSTATRLLFTAEPFTPQCRVIRDEGEHAVIGVSPGNSYFSARRVDVLARWGLEHFRRVDLIYTDLHVTEMYTALGYPPQDARRKAVKNIRGVRAKVLNAAASADPSGLRLRGRPVSALANLPAYQRIHRQLLDMLSSDRHLIDTCDALIDRFLAGRLAEGQPATVEQREACLRYVCAEAPLFMDTPAILDVPSSVNCYHQSLPMAELLYARGSGVRASRNQGHAILTPTDVTPHTPRSRNTPTDPREITMTSARTAAHGVPEARTDPHTATDPHAATDPPLSFPFSARGDQLPDEVDGVLRAEPVKKVRTIAGDEAWLVSSHSLCKQVLEDPRFSLKETSAPGVPRQYALTIPPEVVNNMGNITGAGLRRAVLRALNPKAPGLVDWMTRHAHELIDGIEAEGAPVDLRESFTTPYSSGMHCHILGVPLADAPKLARSLDIAFMNSASPVIGAKLNWDRDIAYMTARLDDPTTAGLMAELAALRDDPDYADVTDEMFATVGVTMFGAGTVSTMGFLTMAMISLFQRPELAERLAAEPTLIPSAVEELLRVNLSIGDALPRVALEDVTLGEVEVASGELVLVLVEGANTDPEVFGDPHRVDLGRSNSAAHLSFGGGAHYCPATALARTHAQIALEALLTRLPGLALAVPMEELVWRTRFMKRLPERLPVCW